MLTNKKTSLSFLTNCLSLPTPAVTVEKPTFWTTADNSESQGIFCRLNLPDINSISSIAQSKHNLANKRILTSKRTCLSFLTEVHYLSREIS